MFKSVEQISRDAVEHVNTLRGNAETFDWLAESKEGIRYKLATFLRVLAARVDKTLPETDDASPVIS